MEKSGILDELNILFRDILDNDNIILVESTIANDIEEWDSLTHIQLIVAIEKKFKIKFGSMEILSWKNVGEMIQSIANKS
jgi:acyl carrier protein